MTTQHIASDRGRVDQTPSAGGLTARSPFGVSLALAAVTLVAAAVTFFADGVLRGTAVMNGSARGTALVMLAVAVPALLVSMLLARRGSDWAVLAWLGTVGYLIYNAVLFLFATPFNPVFLGYVLLLSLSLAAAATIAAAVDVRGLASRFAEWTPVRSIAVYVWIIVVLNALVWLMAIVPGLGDADRPAFLKGTGLTTNPIYVQDLAIWLPLATVAAVWLWRRQPWGYLIVGGLLLMWLIEAIGVATDQWFGHNADPTSTVASASMVLPFAVFAVVNAVATFLLLRGLPAPTSRA